MRVTRCLGDEEFNGRVDLLEETDALAEQERHQVDVDLVEKTPA